jgi:hypothetical protein
VREDASIKRAASAMVLAQDSASGGRFKRIPSIPVSHDNSSISFINGGWLVLDQSVRAGSEARKFAERESLGATTLADERITQRLECLAMGQDITISSDDKENTLELDVREALKVMNLPLSKEGAKEALIRIGRWTEASSPIESKLGVSPWSKSILEASQWYSSMDNERRKILFQSTQKKGGDIEGRTDLTNIPAICVDAKATTFRDDAIGVRPRSTTGRRVIEGASKWEILIHITDVSDIFVPELEDENLRQSNDLIACLRRAAEGRGSSRYDLPMGPLHLLPTSLLDTLGLVTLFKPDLTRKAPSQVPSKEMVNRCVTLWAYIDERNGKLLDAGFERTLISCPMALSYASASALLDGSHDQKIDQSSYLNKARAILGVVERNVGLWNEYHRSQNDQAQAREQRLAVKEQIGALSYNSNNNGRDDGSQGFQRTRAHRLVDDCLGLYGYTASGFLKRAKAPIPRVAGTGPQRQGRIATAPLRRYIDGLAQRQLLAVTCSYGGPPMTKQECIDAGKAATDAINAISNIQSIKPGQRANTSKQQREALKSLKRHVKGNNKPVPAVSTGKPGEVVILGTGAVASCRGIKGTLAPGKRIMVRIQNINEESGILSVRWTGNDE